VYVFLGGWTLTNHPPAGLKKAVLVAAPHTSNWDFPITMSASWAANYKLRWLGKESLLKPPLGWLLRPLGGIFIDRSKAHGTVAALAEAFAAAERLIIAVPASGTRSARPRWKSGFYHIAREAQVPVLCAYVDYTRHEITYGPCFIPTGDVKADMDVVREFFAGAEGRWPEKHSTILLAEEAEAAPTS
jgi:1-acyl-sn-glycerol-3-phosphate acyltransferase